MQVTIAAAPGSPGRANEDSDLSHPGTPSATVAIVQVTGRIMRYLVLGDVTVVIDSDDGIRVVSDQRVSRTAAAEHALTGEVPVSGVRQVAVLSDGAARAVEFGLYDWPDVLDALRDAGPDALIRQVRGAEASDPEAARWPRNKISDDATAAYITAF